VRAIGLWLPTARIAQVSVNVEDHRAVALAAVLAAVERHHAVAGAELVAPAPEAAVAGWPGRVDLRMPPPLEALLSR
jgi:glutamate formiminotransferase